MEGVAALDPGHQLPHVWLASFLSSSWHPPTPAPDSSTFSPRRELQGRRYPAWSRMSGLSESCRVVGCNCFYSLCLPSIGPSSYPDFLNWG